MGLSGVPATRWWNDILGGIGASSTANNFGNLNAWADCEGGDAAYNPFNTTEPAAGATDYNSVGVKNYPSYQSGLHATLVTLQNGYYGQIIAALKSNASRSVFAGAVGSSPWGTSGACIGGSSGVTPPPGGTGGAGPPTITRANRTLRNTARTIARATRDNVWLEMYWRTMGGKGWPK